MLSKRTAQLEDNIINRIETMVKQLRFNDLLHSKHEHKVKNSEDHDRVANKAKRYIDRLVNDLDNLDNENKKMREKVKKNLEDRKEIKYYLNRLRESWDFYNGKHLDQEDVRKIEKENEKYIEK